MKTRRITANLPIDLLQEAFSITHKGITETLVQGLHLIKKRRAYEKGLALKGRLSLDVDMKVSRERSRH